MVLHFSTFSRFDANLDFILHLRCQVSQLLENGLFMALNLYCSSMELDFVERMLCQTLALQECVPLRLGPKNFVYILNFAGSSVENVEQLIWNIED